MADEEENGAIEQAHRPRGMWSGTISFGLVSVPVALYPAVRDLGVRLRMLSPAGTPLARRYYCPEEGVDVHPEHLIRGYEVDEGRFVTVTAEELEALEPEKSRDIDLQQFVDLDELDPVYFERAYYLVPDSNSTKAYRLLAGAMERTGKAGIARFVMRDKEYLVAIISENGILRAETMRFFDEVRSPDEIDLPEPGRADAAAREKFARAIEKLARKSLDPAELADERTGRLLKLLERKRRADEGVVEVPELVAAADDAEIEDEDAAESMDLMEVLRASLAGRPEGRSARRGGRDESPARAKSERARGGRRRGSRAAARRRE
jgi:DNA end-binding protein Ku